MNQNIFYTTGVLADGTKLVGGAWKAFTQEGFPLGMTHVSSVQEGLQVDWLEAMSEAHSLGQLSIFVRQLEAFMPLESTAKIKAGFGYLLNKGETGASIMAKKKELAIR